MELSLKQALFLQKYFETGNATEAAMQAYECKDRLSARNIGSENLAKLGITMRSMLDERGITDDFLVGKIKDLFAAKKYVRRVSKDGNTFEEEVADIMALSKALDIAFKLKGSYPPPPFVPAEQKCPVPHTFIDALRSAQKKAREILAAKEQEKKLDPEP